MVNELVNSILEAEKKAEEIISSANAECAEIISLAEKEAKLISTQTDLSLKVESKKVIEDYNAKAEKHYAKTVEEGTASAEKIKNSAKNKTDEIAEDVVRWVVSGNC